MTISFDGSLEPQLLRQLLLIWILTPSLVLQEHVFWVVSLNTLFILVFGMHCLDFFCNCTLDINYCVIINFWVRKCFSCVAFCPYHIGHFSVVGLGFEDYVSADLSSQSDTAVNGRLRINWSFLVSGSCFSLRGPHHHHCGVCPVGSDAHCVPCILSHNHLSLDYRISLEFGWIICMILS